MSCGPVCVCVLEYSRAGNCSVSHQWERVGQVSLSRFFAWVANWRNFSPFFNFLKKVHGFRQTLMGNLDKDGLPEDEEDHAAPEPVLSAAAQGASVGNRQRVQEELVSSLKEMRAKKHTLTVAYQILADARVKVYAHMTLWPCFVSVEIEPRVRRVLSCLFLHEFSQLHLMREYLRLLDETKTQQGSIQVQANWSVRGWASVISSILSDLNAPECLRKLRLDTPAGEAELEEAQKNDLHLWRDLTIRAASQRSWSMLAEYDLAPAHWAGLLHETPEIAAEHLKTVQEDPEIVHKALDVSHDNGNHEKEA